MRYTEKILSNSSYVAEGTGIMMLMCQVDGCEQDATYHITERGEMHERHYCEEHARQYLTGADDQPLPSSDIDWDSYCNQCGHDDGSYTPADPSFTCPHCSRQILDLTGTRHAVVTDSPIPNDLIHECRSVPVSVNGDDLTVVSDFADNEQLEKLRFVMNRRILAVFAKPHHIDALLDAYF